MNIVERVLVAGDSHGDLRYMERLFDVAVEKNCDALYVVGDFGFWPRPEELNAIPEFIRECSEYAENTDVDLYWLDGNHENHDRLLFDYVYPWFLFHAMAGVFPGPFIPITDRVSYAWRGSQWSWNGKRFMAVGGAYSVDKGRRVKYVSWWPEEEMTYGESRRILEGTRPGVDVMLTHDLPEGADPGWRDGWESLYPAAAGNRKMVAEIAAKAAAPLLIHGHMHHRYTSLVRWENGQRCKVVGLGANINEFGDSHVLLDLTHPDVEYHPFVTTTRSTAGVDEVSGSYLG